ncbi:MAG: hypothetical protein KAV82_04750 [Phycisphaerae bacterium]|nr:hypothetical protein [Phycisphaerae bacterium]
MNARIVHLLIMACLIITLGTTSAGCKKELPTQTTEDQTASAKDAHSPAKPADAAPPKETYKRPTLCTRDDGKMPETYIDALGRLGYQLVILRESIASGEVREVHAACDRIAELCAELPQLPPSHNGGISVDTTAEINQTQIILAGKAGFIKEITADEVVDQFAGLQDEMVTLHETLCRHASDAGSNQDREPARKSE